MISYFCVWTLIYSSTHVFIIEGFVLAVRSHRLLVRLSDLEGG